MTEGLFPSEFGTIVNTIRPNAPHMLYFVGWVHRDPHVDYYPDYGPRAQVEVYHIARSLMQARKIQLLLVEGRFAETDYYPQNQEFKKIWKENPPLEVLTELTGDPSMETLLSIFDAPTPPVYAYDILCYLHDANLQGFHSEEYREQSDILWTVRYFAAQGDTFAEHMDGFFNPLIEYLYLKDTGEGMQNVLGVIDREIGLKRITSKDAIIIRGVGHLAPIEAFALQDRIMVEGMQQSKYPLINKPLNFSSLGYGVTIIKPNSLEISPRPLSF